MSNPGSLKRFGSGHPSKAKRGNGERRQTLREFVAKVTDLDRARRHRHETDDHVNVSTATYVLPI
jgi:hypothetical protein